jgi:MFS family permease
MADEKLPGNANETARAGRPTTAAPTEPELHGTHDPYAAFRFKAYRYYAVGNLVSVTGRAMLAVAVGWEIFQRTRSAMALGMVGLVQALPVILFAIPAGHVADRFSRKKVLMVTQLLSALGSVGLAVISRGRAPVAWMFVLLFVTACARTFNWAARGSFMPNLVPGHAFPNAVAWNSNAFQIGSVVGPAMGGFLVAWFGFPLVYGFDAFCGFAFFLLLIPIKAAQPHARPAVGGIRELFSGIHFVWKTKIVLATITLDLFAVLLGGATALLPVFASDILHCGAIGLGWLRAAPSVGAVVMGLVIAHLPPMRRAGTTLLWAVTGFGVATVVFGLSRSFWLSMAMLFLTGAFDNVSVVVRHTLVQLLTPDTMRGRVSAVNNVFIGSSNELGAFESGVTAAWFGPVISVVAGGVGTVLVVLAAIRLWPALCGLGSFVAVKPAAVGDAGGRKTQSGD